MIARYRVTLTPQLGPARETELNVRERSPLRAAMRLFVLLSSHGWNQDTRDGIFCNALATVKSPPGHQHGVYAMWGGHIKYYRQTLAKEVS